MNASPFERLRGIASGYMQSSVLAAAAELDCFTHILARGNSLGAAELAAYLGCEQRGLEVLLDALAAMQLLGKNSKDGAARYSVTQDYAEALDSREKTTMIPMLRHMAGGQRTWSRLTWSVKDGKPQERHPSILGAEEDRVSFIMAMNSIALQLAGPTVESLRAAGVLDFAVPHPRLLDIGGASGTYTQAFLEALPQASATVFDLSVGIAQARKRFIGSAFEGRVNLIEGDFLRDALPEAFDFAWLSAIIHSHSREESRAIYKNALQALNRGGVLAVRDYMMSPDRTSPPDGTLFGVNMLVNTPHGRVYTFDEVKEDLEAVGFGRVRLAVPGPGMSAVVVATK